jgi:hypothetical protein
MHAYLEVLKPNIAKTNPLYKQVYSKVKFPKIDHLGHCFKLQIDTCNSIKTVQIPKITCYFASINIEELKFRF